MKKYLFLFLILTGISYAQQLEYSYGNAWRLGLNFGGTRVTSDLSNNYTRGAIGFTIEKGLTKSEMSPLSFDLRYRFLSGSASGKDTRINDSLLGNGALDGTNNSPDYLNNGGVFINNYRTFIIENDLELKVGLNRLLRKRKIHLYFWGGLGLASFNTKVDALDISGNRYDFSNFSSLNPVPINSQNGIFDGTYETNANGNNGSGIVKFAPSCGFGIGYKFSRFFSIIYEHKLTFPGSDLMDGESNFHLQNKWTEKNDYFTYGACKLLFSFGRGGKNTNNTYTNHNTYTNVSGLPPEVKIISPSQNSFASNSNVLQVFANVKYVSDQSGVSVTVNGNPFYGFSFTSTSGTLSFNTNLLNGNNVIIITGTNNFGTDSEVLNVSWNQQPTGQPPIVNITTPLNNFSTQNSPINVNALVSNVSQSNQIYVNVNGSTISNFIFNPSNSSVNFMTNLNQGNNTITVSANNSFGNDSKSINVYYSLGFSTINPPTVTITNPTYAGFVSNSQNFTFLASATGVNSSSQLGIKLNGNPISNFSFNSSNGQISVPTLLNSGSNSISITATNNSGSDTKTSNVIYTPTGNPPVVTFLNPPTTNYTSAIANITIQAQVTNITSSSNIQVYANSNPISNFSFNSITKFLSFPLTLNSAVTTIIITGTNSFGSDSKSASINFNLPVQPKPTVTIINPPYPGTPTQNPTYNFTALITGVNNASQLNVMFNGQITSNYTFNSNTGNLSLSSQLNSGSNYFTVTATNSSGSDSKSTSVIYNVGSGSNSGNNGNTGNTGNTGNNGGSGQQNVTICHYPPGNTSNPQQITIPMSAWPAHQAHGDVMGGCLNNNNGNVGNGNSGLGNNNNNGGSNNNGNTGNTGNNGGLGQQNVTICHYPPGNTANPQQITITMSAWPAHQAHGDVMGGCLNNNNGNVGNGNSGLGNNNGNTGNTGNNGGLGQQNVTICHYPPGNTSNPQQITIPMSAWPAHQAHGDVMGGCLNNNNGNVGNGNSGLGNNNNNGGSNNNGNTGNTGNNGGSGQQNVTICHYPPGNTSNPQQ
ncbi:MAG: hypothetical protein ACK5D5_03895, partial [Bacteroidota bacterium]